MERLRGKVALVTGAARGHGRAHAMRLAAEGADVVAFDIAGPVGDAVPYAPATADDLATTVELVERQGRRALPVVGDVRVIADLEAAVERATEELGGIDVVVANAAVNTYGPFWAQGEAEWDVVIDTNLKGVWNTVRATAPGMIERRRGGSMILISSVGGIRGLVGMVPYVASKHGVTGLARAFSNELGPHSIRVNSIHPGTVPGTGMGAIGEGDVAPEQEAMFWDGTRGTHPGTILVEDIAAAAAWLASDDARFVTGTQVVVDQGGTTKP